MIDSDFFNNGSFRALTANEMQALSGVVDGRNTYVVMPSAESHFGINQPRLLSDNTTIEEHTSHILVQGYDAEYGINYLYGSAPSKADSLTLGLEYYKQSGLFVSYPSNHPDQIKTELAGYQVYPKTQKSDSISDTVVARTGLSIDSSFSTGGVNPEGPISSRKDLDSTNFVLPPVVKRGSTEAPESTFNGKATFDEDQFLSKNVKHLYNASRYNTYVGKFSDPKLEPVVKSENPKAPEAKVDDGYGGIIFPYNFAFSMVDQAGITVIKEETFKNYDQVGTLLKRQPYGLSDILKTSRTKTDKRSPLDEYDHPGFDAKGDLLSYSSECCSWNNEMIWIREDKEKSWFDLYIPVEHYSRVVDISTVKVVLAELDTPIKDVFKQDPEGNLTNLSEHTRYENNVSEVWDISYRYDTYGWEIENPPCHTPPGKETGSNVTYIVYKFKKDGTDYDVAKRWDFRFWGAEAWTDGNDYVPKRTELLGDDREVQNLCKTFKVMFHYKTEGGIADGDGYRKRTDQEIIDAIEDTEFTREEHVIVGSNKTAEEEGYGQKEFLSTGFDLKFPKDYPGRKKIDSERKDEVWVMPQEPAQSDPKPIIDTSRSCPSIVEPNTGRINELAAHAQASAKDIFASQPDRIAANRSHGMPISLSNFTPIIEESVFSYRKLNEYLHYDDYACGSPCGEENVLERKVNDYRLIRASALPRFYKYNDFHRPTPIGYPLGHGLGEEMTADEQLKKLFTNNSLSSLNRAEYTYQTWNKNINRSKIETALIEPSLLLRSDRVDANGLTMKASFENRYGDNLGPVTKETICGDGTIQVEERVYLPLKEFIDVEFIDDWENRQFMIRTKWKWDQPISSYSRTYGNSAISYSWFRSRHGIVLLPDEVIDYINRTTNSRRLDPYRTNYIEDYKLDYQPAKIKLRLSWPIEVEDTNPSSSTFGQKLVTYENKWLEIPIHLQIDLIGDIPAGASPLKGED